ncbi:MAG: nucleotidyltransferase family protein [Bacteroidales bacterium]|nr:nucleotidyltransferase family protein [Bacteroidales bacterium]
MKAMIFAAGLGTRLYPITKDRPKAMAEVNGITLLEHNIRFIAAQGFDEIIINVHHFSEKVIDFLKSKNNFGLKIEISREIDLLDTAGGLAKAASFFDHEDFLLYNVDVVSNIDLQAMLAFHQQQNAIATLALRQRETSRYLLFDKQNHLAGWRNKSTNDEILCGISSSNGLQEFAFSGIHIISPQLLPLLGVIRKHSLTPFYLDVAKEKIIAGYEHTDDIWFDCGKPETLAQASEYLKR